MKSLARRVRRTWGLFALFCLLAALVVPTSTAAQDTPIVSESMVDFGSVWSYLDTGIDPGPGWQLPDFDDAAWASGPAHLGYGDGDEATIVSFGGDPNNRFPVTLFRRSFDVAELHQVLDVRMQVERDDAAIVYLNGAEVWRSDNLPPNPTFTDYATGNAIEGAIDDVFVAVDSLIEGTNTVAVQLHNRGAENSDIRFDLAIEANRDLTILPGPSMAPDEFVGPAGEVISGTVATNDLAGLTYSVAMTPDAAQGSLTLDATGAFTFDPAPGFAGTVTVAVTGCDAVVPEFCGVRELALRIEGVVALDDGANTDIDTSITGNVGANDSSNGNGALTWTVLTGPADNEGVLEFGTDGGWSFTPAPGFGGVVVIGYQACDAQGDCDQAILVIRVGTGELVVEFSRERGFFADPFSLTITASDPLAQIWVSTDWGTEWDADAFVGVARLYDGPIEVSESMQVRAVAIDADGQRTKLQSHSFIDLSGYGAQDRAVIESYPAFVSTGTLLGSRSIDAVTISEFWHPNGSSIAAPAAIRNRQGGINQSGEFRLYYRSEYGDGRLDYELFPNEVTGTQGAGAHDKVNFHGGSQDAFGYSWNYNGCPIGSGTLMRDRYFQRTQRDVHGDGVRGEYYLMWHQGRLVGVKNAEDVPQHGFMEEYFGGDKDAYNLWTWYSRELDVGNAYDVSHDINSFYAGIDVTNYIDYLLTQWFAGNADWASVTYSNNNVVVGGLFDGPYYHWTWDSHAASPGCAVAWGQSPRGISTPFDHPDFRMDFADRALIHFGPGGQMTEPAMLARWDALADELRPAVPLVTSRHLWDSAQQSVRDQITGTSAELFAWLEEQGYASTVPAVTYSLPAGAVASGTQLTLTGGGEIWFTIDGTDPRARGGEVSESAHRYEAPVTLPDGTVQVLARMRDGESWSAARPMIYRVGDGPGLVINEIHFHPSDGEVTGVQINGDEYEFIELANLGSTAVDLEYFRLQGGVRFKFDFRRSPLLQPGEFVVLAENAQRFTERYGFAPDGEYLDKLSNSSDEIRLVDTELNTIDTVVYSDGWDSRTDGHGASLSFIGEGNNNIAAAWGRSSGAEGTPGAPNVVTVPRAAEPPGIVVNEWNSVSPTRLLSGTDAQLGQVVGNGGDWFELVVVDDGVDARGWTIEVGDVDDVTILTLSEDLVWSNLRSGTIITIAEDAVITAADGTSFVEDASYDPVGGDWWIHAVAGDAGSDTLVTAANFAVTANDWQATIRDAGGTVVWGPVGEGIGALPKGVGNTEIGELEADPTTDLDPVVAPYDDGDDSTFGLANIFDGVTQDLAVLRSVVNAPPSVSALPDRTDQRGDTIAPITNTAGDPEGGVFTWAAQGLPPGVTIDPDTGTISGQVTEPGAYDVVVQAVADLNIGTAAFTWTITEPEVSIAATCEADAGTVDVAIVNSDHGFVTYRVVIGEHTQQRSLSTGLSTMVSRSGLDDGTVVVAVERDGTSLYAATLTIDCGPIPQPILVPTPTPTPVPNPAEPNPAQPMSDPVEVSHTITCLAGNGRIDTNIVNTGDAPAEYRIELEGLSPRAWSVGAGDWWRMPITGRPDRDYAMAVLRDGVVVSQQTLTVACDTDPPQVTDAEVQVINACRAGLGYLLFQFANPTPEQRGWVIEFENVPNRSTSAAGHAGSLRAVTGRRDGNHDYAIRVGPTTIATGTVTVAC